MPPAPAVAIGAMPPRPPARCRSSDAGPMREPGVANAWWNMKTYDAYEAISNSAAAHSHGLAGRQSAARIADPADEPGQPDGERDGEVRNVDDGPPPRSPRLSRLVAALRRSPPCEAAVTPARARTARPVPRHVAACAPAAAGGTAPRLACGSPRGWRPAAELSRHDLQDPVQAPSVRQVISLHARRLGESGDLAMAVRVVKIGGGWRVPGSSPCHS